MRRAPTSRLSLILAALALAACTDQPTNVPEVQVRLARAADASALAAVGESIFFDEHLSLNGNQSCAACHDPEWGFTGPLEAINAGGAVYEGSVPGRFGNRKPPSAAYATVSPVFEYIARGEGLYVGGNFWDGRATGEKLGNPAADQAQGPFLNPAEQALRDAACVVYRVANGAYASDYTAVWGDAITTIAFPANTDDLCAEEGGLLPLGAADRAKVETEYDNIGLSIAAYEDSPDVNAFTSKFDAWRKGRAKMTQQEMRGFALFQGKGGCAGCHPDGGQKALFTDFTYDNLGLPANPQNPALLSTGFVDLGLGGPDGAAPGEEQSGQMKVPTLRNVDRRPLIGDTKAFGHNGVFKTLDMIVHFYNTRDVLPTCTLQNDPGFGDTCWPPPEVAENVNREELGDLGLSSADEAAIVAFLRTLSDGWYVP